MPFVRYNQRFFCSFLALLLFAASVPLTATASPDPEIRDLQRLPQDPAFYLRGELDRPLLDAAAQKAANLLCLQKHFEPWERSAPAISREDAFWVFGAYEKRATYGENRRLRKPEWFKAMRENANEAAFGRKNLKAIAVQESDLRLMPTAKPLFLDFALAGEGYPFDYLQNSSVKPGEPLFISHYSRDRAWAYVETSFAAGWMDVRHIALVDAAFMEAWKKGPFVVLVKDNEPITGADGLFRCTAKLGALFPGKSGNLFGSVSSLMIPQRLADGTASLVEGRVASEALSPFPLAFTGWNAVRIASELMDEPYGWGGMLQNRDCSATTRDFFLPFGVWLPRNSAAQAKSGESASFEGLTDEDKSAQLLMRGVPFRTLVAIRGHIMLYIGAYRGEPVVLHNTWGVRTLEKGAEGRRIIGKAVITTLHPGAELPELDSEKGPLVRRVIGIATQPSP